MAEREREESETTEVENEEKTSEEKIEDASEGQTLIIDSGVVLEWPIACNLTPFDIKESSFFRKKNCLSGRPIG